MYFVRLVTLLIIILSSYTLSWSQNIDSLLQAANQVKLSNYQLRAELGLLSTSLSLEKSLTNNSSLFSQISYNLHSMRAGAITEMIYGTSPVYLFIPKTHLAYRYYYNLSKRVLNKKTTLNNSGNYLALNSEIFTSFLNLSNVENYNLGYHAVTLVPAYGLQRSIKDKFNFDLWTGVGLALDNAGAITFTLRLDIRIGIILLQSK